VHPSGFAHVIALDRQAAQGVAIGRESADFRLYGKAGASGLATVGEWVRERAVAGRHRTGVESDSAEERQ